MTTRYVSTPEIDAHCMRGPVAGCRCYLCSIWRADIRRAQREANIDFRSETKGFMLGALLVGAVAVVIAMVSR